MSSSVLACIAGCARTLLGCGIGSRQVDRHGRALADLTFDPDLAARLVGETENLAEAEAGALADLLGREEGLERALLDLGGHAAAGVGHLDAQIFAGAGCRRPRWPPSVLLRVRMVSLPVPSIASRALTARLRMAFSSWCGSTNTGQASSASSVLTLIRSPSVRSSNSLIPPTRTARVDALGQQRLGPGEGQQAAGQRGGAGRAFHRVGEVGHHFAARAVEAAAGKVDPADHDRQHIVEVVGDAAGQLADRFHLLDLAELGFGGLALDRFGLQRLVRFPQFLGPVAHRLFQRLGAFGLALGLAPGGGVLAKRLDRDIAHEDARTRRRSRPAS